MIDIITDSANFIIRAAAFADTRQMAEIAGGDTTARSLAAWMDDDSAHAAWHVAEDMGGALLGFQRIGAIADFAAGLCEIATFLHKSAPLAAGSRLFTATADAARLLGYGWIDARIGVGNESARIYYQSQGFRLTGEAGAQVVMRYDLD